MQILQTHWRPGKRPMAESICITIAGPIRPWEWRHRKRSIPAPGNIKMKFSFAVLRAGSLRSPARSTAKTGKRTTTNSQTKSTKFVSGLDRRGGLGTAVRASKQFHLGHQTSRCWEHHPNYTNLHENQT